MVGREILAFTKESILLTHVSRLVVLEALEDTAICLLFWPGMLNYWYSKYEEVGPSLTLGWLAALR
jgi:hypothetical protein